MTVFNLRPDSVTGYDTYLKSTSNKATDARLSVGRTYTPAEDVETTTQTGTIQMAKIRNVVTGAILYVTYSSWTSYFSQALTLSSVTNTWYHVYVLLYTYYDPVYTTTITHIPASNDIYTSLLKFDLSSLSGVTVNSATLILYMWGNESRSNGYINIHRCLRNWVETQANSDIFSTGNNWQTTRGWGASDHATALMGTATLPATGSPTQFNITLDPAEVQTMINSNYGMWMCGDESDSGSQFWIASSNHATEAYRPFISIDHSGTGTVPAGGVSYII